MKKFLAALILISTLQAWAQTLGQVKLDVKSGITPRALAEGFALLPFTIDVTQVITPEKFQTLTVTDLKAGIMKGNLNLRDYFESLGENVITLSGSLFNYRERKLFVKDEKLQRFRGIEIFCLEANSIFKLNNKVYLQLSGSYALGSLDTSAFSHNVSTFGIDDSETNEYYEKTGVQGAIPWGRATAHEIYNELTFETELTIKKLNIVLFSNQISGKTGRSNYVPVYTNDNTYNLYSHVKSKDLGIRLEYKVGSRPRLGDVALFVGYTFTNYQRSYTGKNIFYTEKGAPAGYLLIEKIDEYSKTDLQNLSGVRNSSLGVLHFGVKINMKRKR